MEWYVNSSEERIVKKTSEEAGNSDSRRAREKPEIKADCNL